MDCVQQCRVSIIDGYDILIKGNVPQNVEISMMEHYYKEARKEAKTKKKNLFEVLGDAYKAGDSRKQKMLQEGTKSTIIRVLGQPRKLWRARNRYLILPYFYHFRLLIEIRRQPG